MDQALAKGRNREWQGKELGLGGMGCLHFRIRLCPHVQAVFFFAL